MNVVTRSYIDERGTGVVTKHVNSELDLNKSYLWNLLCRRASRLSRMRRSVAISPSRACIILRIAIFAVHFQLP